MTMQDRYINLVSLAASFHAKPLKPFQRFRKGHGNKFFSAPYIVHPLNIIKILTEAVSLDCTEENFNIIKAILFHDVIEDCGVGYSELVGYIGKTAADWVKLLTRDCDNDAYLQRLIDGPVEPAVIKLIDIKCNYIDHHSVDITKATSYANKYSGYISKILDRRPEINERLGNGLYDVLLMF